MDIEQIMQDLGLDLSNPEVKRGALEAIDAILTSRIPPMNLGGGGGGSSGGGHGTGEDVEIDPDLLQPSKKFSNTDDVDVEIEDEEDLLSQVKQNESEDNFDDEENSPGSNTSSTIKQSSNSETDVEDGDLFDDSDEIDGASDDTEAASENVGDESDDEGEGNPEGTPDELKDGEADDREESEDEIDSDGEASETDDEEDLDGQKGNGTGEGDPEGENESSEDTLEDDGDETEDDDFSEDDLLDPDIEQTFQNKELGDKLGARRIKRERTLAAAKKALENAMNKNASQALIKELESAIADLEALQEAINKKLDDLSDEEFNRMVNRVFDAISSLDDTELTFTSEEERETQVKEIEADLADKKTQQELSAEDVALIRAEHQAVTAREKENDKYKKRSRGSFQGFQAFLNSLYKAIAVQVHTIEVSNDTWSAINKRYSGTGILKQGQRKEELPEHKIPIIDFYFDCSGSWDAKDISVGKKAAEALADMEEKGQIKLNIFYFADNVHTNYEDARDECGTGGWNEIVKNVIATQATNVVIMTDSDMENYWDGQYRDEGAMKYTTLGYVWYLWKNGDQAPRLPRDLKGRGGTQQFSFGSSDYS